MKRTALPFILAAAVAASVPSRAANTCFTYTPGHVYYVAYQNNPAGPEYIVDLGDRNTFLTAMTKLTLPDIAAGDFSTFFAPAAPNLWVGFFGVLNPATRDAIVSANGPKDQTQLDNCSTIGASQQIDGWATGLPSFSSEVGSAPCHLNAARFAGNVFGSYQATLNAQSVGSLAGNVVWNVETRLSSSAGIRTQTNKIRFNAAANNGAGTSSRSPVGYFIVFTDGTADFWPDLDGDLLPDVAPGTDPEADLCPGVNSTNNADADADLHGAACDCNEADNTVWAIPTEVPGLAFSTKTSFGWSVPANLGGTATRYDVFRGQQASPGANPTYSCFDPNLSILTSGDASSPAAGAPPFLYLVRARTSCGAGTVGQGRNGPVRTVPVCP
jgi:hypothetical protein